MKKYRPPKKKEPEEKREVIVEPVRRSIYDVLQANLKIAQRNTFIHRLLYVGEHSFDEPEFIQSALEKNFKLTNTGYCAEPLSGIVLYYSKYFFCIAEGSEEAFHKHVSLLFEHEGENLVKTKVLATIHHVKARFWNEGMSYQGRPPQRVEEIDAESDLENSMRYVTECCEKLYRFANEFIADQMEHRDSIVENRASFHKQRSRSLVDKDPYSNHIPERKLAQFLLDCKFLNTLKQYHRYYEYIGQSLDFRFKSWPTPKNFVPYDIFDARYDPISDLPTDEEEEYAKMDEEAAGTGSIGTNVAASG